MNTNKIRTIKKVNSNEPAFDAEITRTDDHNDNRAYIVTAERMDQVNWRDDDSISFAKSQDHDPPRSDGIRTILKTTADGRTWLAIPNLNEPLELTSAIPCRIETGGVPVSLFETNSKQNTLSREQIDNIEAVPSKADRHVVDNKVDIRAVTYNDAQKTQIRMNIGAASIEQGANADSAVQFTAQPLTEQQKIQTRTNIGAASIEQGAKADTAVQRSAGSQITVPTVPAADTNAASKGYVDEEITKRINKMYPVGSIYISVNGNNPGSALEIGTWERFGKGRVIVGVDENDADFVSANKAGGEKNFVIKEGEMPYHSHGHSLNIVNENLSGWWQSRQLHDMELTAGGRCSRSTPGTNSHTGSGSENRGFAKVSIDVSHSHTVSGSIGSAGGNQPHNNVQPYVTAYFWLRTA